MLNFVVDSNKIDFCRLSADASAIQGAVGSRGGAICQSIFTIVLAVSAGIYHEWKLGMVRKLSIDSAQIASFK